MADFLQMQRRSLDKHMQAIQIGEVPNGGWIRAVRSALGMSVRQLAVRLGIKQQSGSKLEANEADGSITLNSLRKAAEAMDCRFVYAMIPNGSLDEIVRRQAMKKAAEAFAPIHRTMTLEAQALPDNSEVVRDAAEELIRKNSKKLWNA
jgi:predicted DNA-binding mobile mystery protein A